MTAVISKVLKIMDCLMSEGGAPVSLADLARQTQIPKATLHRLLGDLVRPEVLEHGPRGYTFGPRMFEFGSVVPRYQYLRRIALPQLEELAKATQETVHLATLSGADRVLYLEKVHGRTPLRIPTEVGATLPAYCTALGKAMLAYSPSSVVSPILHTALPRRTPYTVVMPSRFAQQLATIRDYGVAIESEETRLGLGCVAAPVIDGDGQPIAAISIAGDPRTKRSVALATRVRAAAEQIASEYRALPDVA